MPPSIREAALGIGASHQQAVFHHVLPLAMPGIMTGTIIGMAHALGETAPLLMIGMVAFIVDIPRGITDAATVLPVQIYLWSDLPEVAFQAKTAAAIIVLLAIPVRDERGRDRACASASSAAGEGLTMDSSAHEYSAMPSSPRLSPSVLAAAAGQGQVARDVNVSITASKQAIYDLDIDIPDRAVSAFIGPSGCGKSTFLRCINRMNDTIPIARVDGKIEIDGQDIYDTALDVVQLRARVGMVFQKPNPFPKSIYENVAYGPRIHGLAALEGRARGDRGDQPQEGRPVRGGEGPAR